MVGDVLFVEKGLNNYGELIKSIQGHEGFEATEINLKLIISGFIDGKLPCTLYINTYMFIFCI